MQQIVSIPSIYSLKLPNGEWLNLALVRRLQFESEPPVAILTWSNGDSQLYNGDQALAIVQAWEEASAKVSGQRTNESEVMEVLRRRGGEMLTSELLEILPECFPRVLNTLRSRGVIAFRDNAVMLRRMPSSSSMTGVDIFVQLKTFGATDALIEAVLESDDLQIQLALATIEDRHKRDHLTEIVQRLGVIQGKAR